MSDINKVLISGYVSKEFEIVKKDFQSKDGKTMTEVNFQLLITSIYQDNNIKNDYVMCNLYNDNANLFYDTIKQNDYVFIDGIITGYKYTTEYGESKLIMKVRCQKVVKGQILR